MNQNFSNERLSAYLDGELDPEEATRVERELAEDSALREEYEALSEAVEFIRRTGPVDAPADFHARVMARASAIETPPLGFWERLLSRLRGVPLEGLAVALAATMVVVILMDKPKPAAPPEPDPPPVVDAAPAPAPAPPPVAEPAPEPAAEPERLAEGPAPRPVPISDVRDEVLDELIASPAADRDGVALAPGGAPESVAPPAVESKVGDAMRAAVTLRVRTDDPLVLQQLNRLAEQNGGVASTPNGEALSNGRLGQSGLVVVRVRLPADRLTSFQMTARDLGEVRTLAQQNKNLYGSEIVDVLVEVDYRP